jgi:hypothetical protein
VDPQSTLLEVEVGPGEGECFGDASAGADEQFGEWAVVRGAGIEVAVDLSEPEVVELAVLDRERCDELARVARQRVVAAGVFECARQRGSGVVDRLG